MRAIKFEKMKEAAIREFFNRSGGNRPELFGMVSFVQTNPAPPEYLALLEALSGEKFQDPRIVLSDWRDKGCAIINLWDIRRAYRLIELFPTCVPTTCSKVPVAVDMDEDGDWAVYFG